MATLKLENITKEYDGVRVVDDFNLDVADKEFIVIVGPSGCGKSTTLRMIAGLETITSGTIEIDGTIVNDIPTKDRDIAMVFQNYALFPHLTVFDNIAFSLRLRKFPEDQIKARVESVAETLGITAHLHKKPKALSGGQKQRVAIGRAMVRDSNVFLLDEPLSNLDAKLRNQMRAELILLRKKLNTTFVYVTHDQTEAMTLGDRIVVMKDGHIMQVGTPDEVFNHPANQFVATFIGSPAMNIMDAEIARDDQNGQCMVKVLGAEMSAPYDISDYLRGSEPMDVKLGVRPEHISLSWDPAKDAVPCTLIVNEMMGSELQLHVICNDTAESSDNEVSQGNKQIELIVRVNTTSLSEDQKMSLRAGQRLYLKFAGNVMHFFDPKTGARL